MRFVIEQRQGVVVQDTTTGMLHVLMGVDEMSGLQFKDEVGVVMPSGPFTDPAVETMLVVGLVGTVEGGSM